jgi:hypothetical protein
MTHHTLIYGDPYMNKNFIISSFSSYRLIHCKFLKELAAKLTLKVNVAVNVLSTLDGLEWISHTIPYYIIR